MTPSSHPVDPDVSVTTEAFQRRVALGALGVVTALVLSILAAATYASLQGLRYPFLHPALTPWQGVAVLGASTLTLALMTEAFRRGALWPTRALTVMLAAGFPFALDPRMFALGLPQAVWLPVVMALALTTLRWTLVVAAVDALAVVVAHPDEVIVGQIAPASTSLAILAMLLVARLLQDRLLRAERERSVQMRQLGLYDALTGLPNRRLLRDRLEQAVKRSERRAASLAVLFLDLDRFKEVNDALGHATGDQLLVDAVGRMRRCVRATDTLARLGGDEFCVVVSEVTSRAAIDRIAAELNRELGEAFRLGEDEVFVSASIGIAVFPEDGRTPDELLRRADRALYVSKEQGRNRASYFTRSLEEAAEQRLRLTKELRAALGDGQLLVHYQPIVDLRTGVVCKAEALVRWRHPTLGMVSPAAFIPVAETSGLIHGIGDWILQEAALQVRAWREAYDDRFQISVNRSPAQFSPGANVAPSAPWPEQLRALGVPADGIAMEITEGLLLDEREGVRKELEAMRAEGIGVVLDDFGTGYSALAYLQRYPIDVIKIDRAFVRELAPGTTNHALCRAIIQMAHELGMKVVAEGVEAEAERDLLLEAGCDFAQGYLFGKPVAAGEFELLLQPTREKREWIRQSRERFDVVPSSGSSS
jgi:diguanylate cyclase (GGDEF)-like protein